MLSQVRILPFVVITVLMITGCSNTLSRNDRGFANPRIADFAEGESIATIKTPPGTAPVQFDTYFSIPSITDPDGSAVVLYPPGSLVLEKAKQKDAKQKEKG